MPAEMLRVGPSEIRRGDRTLRGGTQVEVIDMLVAGLTGKMLRFDNGSTYLLRSGDELQVWRGAEDAAPARRVIPAGRTAADVAAAQAWNSTRQLGERAERHSQAAIEMWARRRRRFAAARAQRSEQSGPRGPYPGEEQMLHCGNRMRPQPVQGGGVLYTCNRCGHLSTGSGDPPHPQ
ncbi:hypothetical protein G4Z16_00545 [Streptomyces bathyalis]|uniref:Uncharacterized protein n=1 Tax=Streptomyces bathyalis TaxID=2710756 RepID=A0A7T1T2C9_9ACTN|nr:hypothetical protein [Streptomyces bathyalis]QPP05128.1 hypothetical protein G4Z16_00545 [Streptomyces bathyalis]